VKHGIIVAKDEVLRNIIEVLRKFDFDEIARKLVKLQLQACEVKIDQQQ
jgi:hypothetical protein